MAAGLTDHVWTMEFTRELSMLRADEFLKLIQTRGHIDELWIGPDFAMGRGRTPEDPDLAGMMKPEEVAEAVLYAVTRPRTLRMLEASLLPMAEDSMG